MSDVAERVNVSQATVSYVLNGQDNSFITAETRQRILTAVNELGYSPNRAARALVTGQTHTIALWTFQIYPGYYADVIRRISSHLKEDRYDGHLMETHDRFDPEWGHRNLASLPVDGVLAFDSPTFVSDYLQAHPKGHPPIVSIGSNPCRGTDYVEIDLYPAAVEAVRHLAASGRRRIAYLASREDNQPQCSRYRAYTDVCRELGLEPELIDIASPQLCRPVTREGVKQYVRVHGCPQAIFCFNDEAAVSAYRGLLDMSLRIPDDVALVGCNGTVDTEYLEVPLSTLVVPVQEMCSLAWDFLKRRMTEPDLAPQREVLQLKLVVRASSRQRTGALPMANRSSSGT